MLYQERPEVMLVPFGILWEVPFGILWEISNVSMGTTGNLL
jgi:hypothetical protein